MLTDSVIVEKPFASSSKDADRAIAAAKQSGKLLTVFQSRYLPFSSCVF